MAGFGGYFSGEKKKPKKGTDKNRPMGITPVFVPPKLIPKGKKPEDQ